MTDCSNRPSIACGVAGWSYPDWKGVVYPRAERDPLRYLIPFVDMIEINSTFYRPAERRQAQRWADAGREQAGFFYAVKINGALTHETPFDPAAADAFRAGLEPLVERGLLRYWLAQFRWDYADVPANRDRLSRLIDKMGSTPLVVVELRHRSWQTPEALSFLGKLPISLAHLDYPVANNSFDMRLCPVGSQAYLRLHGRNREAWFDREAGRDATYNYLYPAPEIEEIAQRAMEIKTRKETLTIVANNHFQGKAVVAALQLKARLTGSPVDIPPLLQHAYPVLTAIARPFHLM